jgi:hypothetical protein
MALIQEENDDVYFNFINSIKSDVTKEIYEYNIKKFMKFCNIENFYDLCLVCHELPDYRLIFDVDAAVLVQHYVLSTFPINTNSKFQHNYQISFFILMELPIFLEKYCGKMIKNTQEVEFQRTRRNNWR